MTFARLNLKMGKDASTSPRGKMLKDTKTPDATTTYDATNDHLPPFFLVLTVMACSGFLFVYSFRDVFATGRNIGGVYDNAYLVCFVGYDGCVSAFGRENSAFYMKDIFFRERALYCH